MFEKWRTVLAGKKTYIVGVGAILAALVGWIDGTTPTDKFIEQAVECVLAMTIRAGVAKAS